ncbi:MAG: hypothetical protein RLZZ401_1648, partial [Pseudomonadota bacterium]
MKIDKDCAVTLRARITDTQGKLLDDGKHPSVYLHG